MGALVVLLFNYWMNIDEVRSGLFVDVSFPGYKTYVPCSRKLGFTEMDGNKGIKCVYNAMSYVRYSNNTLAALLFFNIGL